MHVVKSDCCSVLIFVLFGYRTWSGPAWSPAQSLSSVLISIQSLLNEKPYHNEPGFEQVCRTVDKCDYMYLNDGSSIIVNEDQDFNLLGS